VLGINHPTVSNLFCYCVRSVVDLPPQIFGGLAFLAAKSRESGLGTNRYVHSSQELGEQVLVFGIDHTRVTNLFCYCIRSVVDLPPQIFGHLCVSRGKIMGEWPCGLTGNRYVHLSQ